MSVLVTGGAGYIGGHMVLALLERGERVVVIDNLSTGLRQQVTAEVEFVEGDAGDSMQVSSLIAAHDVDAILHFAGSIVVPESVEKPLLYYRNNTMVSRNLIEAAIANGVKNFIFSSTAAVYQSGSSNPIDEKGVTDPMSPYGRSKLMTEWMLTDASKAHEFRHVALRYFNVAGADPNGRVGQTNPDATHLIKRSTQVALGRLPYLEIFGFDYPTGDGTGIRDYIHVADLIAAHELALDHLRMGGPSITLNCGYGHGVSVREVIAATERVTGRKLAVREGPRRAGDPAMLVADSRLIRDTLGWKPKLDNLDEIIRSAYEWERHLNSAKW